MNNFLNLMNQHRDRLTAIIKKAAGILRITWDEAWHLMQRAVLRGRATKGAVVPEQMASTRKRSPKGIVT